MFEHIIDMFWNISEFYIDWGLHLVPGWLAWSSLEKHNMIDAELRDYVQDLIPDIIQNLNDVRACSWQDRQEILRDLNWLHEWQRDLERGIEATKEDLRQLVGVTWRNPRRLRG
jgi:hypothetical protein